MVFRNARPPEPAPLPTFGNREGSSFSDGWISGLFGLGGVALGLVGSRWSTRGDRAWAERSRRLETFGPVLGRVRVLVVDLTEILLFGESFDTVEEARERGLALEARRTQLLEHLMTEGLANPSEQVREDVSALVAQLARAVNIAGAILMASARGYDLSSREAKLKEAIDQVVETIDRIAAGLRAGHPRSEAGPMGCSNKKAPLGGAATGLSTLSEGSLERISAKNSGGLRRRLALRGR